jgi:hypothetical protein
MYSIKKLNWTPLSTDLLAGGSESTLIAASRLPVPLLSLFPFFDFSSTSALFISAHSNSLLPRQELVLQEGAPRKSRWITSGEPIAIAVGSERDVAALVVAPKNVVMYDLKETKRRKTKTRMKRMRMREERKEKGKQS